MSTPLKPAKYVGFDTVTEQIETRLLKRGFQLNVMVVGRLGLGKLTLVNSLFSAPLAASLGRRDAQAPLESTTEIKVTSHVLEEGKVRLSVSLIDTPGFGDQINNDKCWEPLVKYIKEQNSVYLRKELKPQRERFIPDTRVHCVLYFLPPVAKLKALDAQALARLTEVANVIPVIAKLDTLTAQERADVKRVLQLEFANLALELYPYDSDELTEEERTLNADLRRQMPLAVVGAEGEFELNGVLVRGRRLRWGAVNIDDLSQCEFTFLRDMLARLHLHDLVETTLLVHYEAYRHKQMVALKDMLNRQLQPVARPPTAQPPAPSMAQPQSMVFGVPTNG